MKRLMTEWFEVCVVGLSLFLGLAAAVAASSTAAAHIPSSFYSTIAQILPVFLVALAVEQRIVDRLGLTENEYAARANRALDLAIGAALEFEAEEKVKARELEESFDSQPEFRWVGKYATDAIYIDDPDQQPDISALARSRYQRQRKNEAVFVGVAVALLLVGEGAALMGMLQAGSSRCAPYLLLSVGSTVAVVAALTLSAGRDFLNSVRR